MKGKDKEEYFLNSRSRNEHILAPLKIEQGDTLKIIYITLSINVYTQI